MGKPIKIKKVKRVQFSQKLKEEIAKECGYKCQLCPRDLKYDKPGRRIDHKIPLSKGGTNDKANLWLLCDDCDEYKQNHILEAASQSAVKKAMDAVLKKHPYLKNKTPPPNPPPPPHY